MSRAQTIKIWFSKLDASPGVWDTFQSTQFWKLMQCFIAKILIFLIKLKFNIIQFWNLWSFFYFLFSKNNPNDPNDPNDIKATLKTIIWIIKI